MTVTDQEIDLLRRMTPERKLAVMNALVRQAYDLKTAALRARWPELADDEIWARVRRQVGGDCP